MKIKTHQSQYPNDDFDYDDYDDFYGNTQHLSPPNFTKSPLILKRIDDYNNNNNNNTKKIKMTKSQSYSSSSCSMISKSDQNNPLGKWSLGSLMAALPLSPSPVCSDHHDHDLDLDHDQSGSHRSSPFPRTSVEYFTPTHQTSSVFSSLSFRKQEQTSPKCMSISTLYESAIDQGYRVGERSGNAQQTYTYSPKNLPIPAPLIYQSSIATAESDEPVDSRSHPLRLPNEMARIQRQWDSTKLKDFASAEPVTFEEEEEHLTPVNRPKPYQEFLNEIENHKHRAEVDAWKKTAYTDLHNKLKKKEAAIDCWESNQRSKVEFQLDRLERKLDKKRARAVQRMHQKFAEVKMEAERRKARERQSVLKEFTKLSQKRQGSRLTARVLCLP